LEKSGGRAIGLAGILVGVVPVMAGLVLGIIRFEQMAIWLTCMSPASMPFYAVSSLLPISELPPHATRAIPRAFHFWLFVSAITAIWLVLRLRDKRLMMKNEAPTSDTL
jgi:hypothetical protein